MRREISGEVTQLIAPEDRDQYVIGEQLQRQLGPSDSIAVIETEEPPEPFRTVREIPLAAPILWRLMIPIMALPLLGDRIPQYVSAETYQLRVAQETVSEGDEISLEIAPTEPDQLLLDQRRIDIEEIELWRVAP